jgi:hypothetical protein
MRAQPHRLHLSAAALLIVAACGGSSSQGGASDSDAGPGASTNPGTTPAVDSGLPQRVHTPPNTTEAGTVSPGGGEGTPDSGARRDSGADASDETTDGGSPTEVDASVPAHGTIDAGAGGSDFFPTSRFDQRLPASPSVDPSSASIVASFVSQYKNNYGSVGVHNGTSGMPIYVVPADTPGVTINGGSGTGNITGEVPIPAGAWTSGSGDSPIVIYQPSSGNEWDLWQATASGTDNWTASWGGLLPHVPTADGVFPSPYGLAASGISYLATTITFADVQAGVIPHAIGVDVVTCNNGFVAPADRTDGNQSCAFDATIPAEGMWFFMPKSVAMPTGLAPFAQMVFTALQDYGMVVMDHAGAVMVGAQNSEVWTWEGHSGTDPITASFNGAQEYQVISNLPWGSMQVQTAGGS